MMKFFPQFVKSDLETEAGAITFSITAFLMLFTRKRPKKEHEDQKLLMLFNTNPAF